MHLHFILIALFISVLWGVTPILLKSLTNKFDTSTIILIQGFLYFFFLLCFGFTERKIIIKEIPKINHIDLIKMFFAAVIGGLVCNILYIKVLEKHDSYITTALVSISPLFTLFLAYYFTRENVTLYGFIGTIFIVFGTLMIVYNESTEPHSNTNNAWMREAMIPLHVLLP